MTDFVTLLGAEEVGRAARTMADAADRMVRAANEIRESNDRLIAEMREDRYQRTAEAHK